MNLKCYCALLLSASVSLSGCQAIEIIPPKKVPHSEKIVAATSIIEDSDGDGVLDNMDACLGTPINMVVDARGCPTPVYIIEEAPLNDFRVFYPENSSEPINFDYKEINRLAELMQEHDKAVMKIQGHIGKHENHEGNETLAIGRADFIKSYVVTNYSIDPVRIITYDYRDDWPIASNDNIKDRKKNQRAYVLVVFRAVGVGIVNSCQ